MRCLPKSIGLIISILSLCLIDCRGQESSILQRTSAYDVIWDSPGSNALGSMPLGNGDIGLNAWVEAGGDLFLYLSKTDAWSENGQLLKLGKIRIHLDPNPFIIGKPFKQELQLVDGAIHIQAGKIKDAVEIAIRVDANHPVAEVVLTATKSVKVSVELLPWRTARRALTTNDELAGVYGLSFRDDKPIYQEADHWVPPTDNCLMWYHRNGRSVWKDNLFLQAVGEYTDHASDPLFYRTFGACLSGTGLRAESPTRLSSQGAISQCTLSIYPLTAFAITEQEWKNQLNYEIAKIKAVPDSVRLAAHRAWWSHFWNRSWIFVSSKDPVQQERTHQITQGYILQRFINACGGRGASPIKFNGSIFTVDTYNRKESNGMDADFRKWGGPYWFQNTRLPYWSMLESGDFEMMKPLFDMYLKALPLRQLATKKYYNHEGAFYPETMNFWGTYTDQNYGTNREQMPDGLTQNTYIRYYWTGGLELSAMMIDYYEFTRSQLFARDTLIPIVREVLEFYDKHWRRDIEGKILFTPAQSLETYQTAVNPTPDLAGLRFVIGKMLHIKDIQISPELRQQWEALLSSVPKIPVREVNGVQVIAPAAYSAQEMNIENPELYAIFPFRLYGVGKPELDLAIQTFVTRKFRSNIGWQHSSIQAASLGLAREAADMVYNKFSTSDNECRFPAFWGPNYDWSPDQDHGNVAMIALQRMILQYEGDSLITFPAWPDQWDVDFRLRAPVGNIQGSSVDGRRHTETVSISK